MNYVIKMALCFILSLFSCFTLANCGKLHVKDGFTVIFEIKDNDFSNTISVTKRNGSGNPVNIWTNKDRVSASIKDSDMAEGGHYKVWLKSYPHQHKEEGTVEYKLFSFNSSSNEWKLSGTGTANFSGLSNAISIQSNENSNSLSGLECSAGNTTPELPDVPELDYCELFPSPVQSWSLGSSITFNNPPALPSTAPHYFVSGWSDAYKKQYLDTAVNPAQLKVGFDSITEHSSGALTCRDGVCNTGGPKINEPPRLVFSGTRGAPDVTFGHIPDTPDEYGQCEAQLVGDTCDGDNRVVVSKHLKSLKVNGDYNNLLTVAFQNNVDHVVQSFVVNDGKVDVVLADKSKHWFETFIVNPSSASISAGEKSVINVTKALTFNNPISINNNGNPDDLVIYASDVNVILNVNQNSVIKALLLAKGVELNNGVHIIGSVTTNKLTVHSPSTLIEGRSECFSSSPKELMITPVSSTGLSCKGVEFDVKVVDSATKELVDYSGPVSVELLTNSTQGCVLKNGEAPTSSCGMGRSIYRFDYPASSSDLLSLTLFSRYVGSNYIRAWADNDPDELSINKVGPYRFLGEAFVLDTTRDVNGVDGGQIAGRNYGLSIKAIATDNDSFSCHPIENYTQEQVPMTFTKSSLDGQTLLADYTISAMGQKSKPISNEGTVIPVNFSGGESTTPLTATYGEAQQVILNVSGPAACTTDDNNQTDDGCTSDETMGSTDLNIYHRPFAFAMCDDDGTALPYGTSKSGSGFTAAGLEYPVVIKAIPWLTGYGDYDSGQLDNLPDTSSLSLGSAYSAYAATFCGADKLHAYTGTPSQTLTLHSPENGTPGSPIIKDCVSEVNTGKQCLLWSEVGSLNMKARHLNYLANKHDVPEAPFVAGRFYPKYLRLTADSFTYPDGQTGFAYMDQNITFDFTVEAQNSGQMPTKNYGLFADDLKASLELMVVDSSKPELEVNTLAKRVEHFTHNPGTPYTWSWTGVAWNDAASGKTTSELSFSETNFTFVRDYSQGKRGEDLRFSNQDGPFDSGNTRMGLFIKTKPDPLDWNYITYNGEDKLKQVEEVAETHIGQVWSSRPDIRYGRLKLDDANSQFDKAVNVPVRAQYWDSPVTAFVLNTDDSTSRFNGGNYCKQVVWVTKPDLSNSIFAGDGKVSDGEYFSLTADPQPSEYFREQVRFWLRLAKSPQSTESGVLNCEDGDAPTAGDYYRPWLQYNWRKNGDEDPSAVVTFGVYRGNDRIIYRGEKGMNRLLN